MSQLRQHEKELESLGVKVAIVTFEIGAVARTYVEDVKLAWPLLIDSSHEIYQAYGMTRGSWWRIYGPATLWMYFELMIRGRKPHRATGDPNQLGGDVLVDPEGIVRLLHVSKDPADRPRITQLLEVIRRSDLPS